MAQYNREFHRSQATDTSVIYSPGRENTLMIGSRGDFVTLTSNTEEVAVPPRAHSVALKDYCIVSNESNPPWLTLAVKPDTRVDDIPVFRTGAVIVGHVQLDLKRPQTLKDVTVRMRGSVIIPQSDKLNFLEVEQSLVPEWAGLSSKYLAGRHILPFTLLLPRHCNRLHTTSTLPPSFSTRVQPISIRYSISAKVKKTGLWGDEHVSLPFAYLPRSRPRIVQPGHLLQFDSAVLRVEPSSDLVSWAVVSKQISATMFSDRAVIFDCSFSLANAPVYTRGSFLSYTLSIETWDAPALELVATPSSVSVSLQRQIKLDLPMALPGLSQIAAKDTCYTEIISTGRCWCAPGEAFPKKLLRGEIPIRRDISPHFAFPILSVMYAVTVRFQVQGFVPNRADDYVFVVPVGITTDMCEGVSPSSRSPSSPPLTSP